MTSGLHMGTYRQMHPDTHVCTHLEQRGGEGGGVEDENQLQAKHGGTQL